MARAEAWAWRPVVRQVWPLLALPLLIFGLNPARDWPAVVANAGLFFVLSFVFTLLHELGHALVGLAVGFGIWRVHVGAGRVVFQTKFLGMDWRFGAVPVGGAALILPKARTLLRTRFWLTIAADPAVNLAFVIAFAQLGRENPSVELAPVRVAFLVNALLALGALLPFRASTMQGMAYTDGLQLISMPFLPERFFRDLLALPRSADVEAVRESDGPEAALRVCEDALLEHPDSVALQTSKGALLLDVGRLWEARELFAMLASDHDRDGRFRLVIQNNLSWTNALIGDPALVAEADELSLTVIRRSPRTAWAQGTRGVVLFRRGQLEPALLMLTRAWEISAEPRLRAHQAAWLAAVLAAKGELAKARSWLETAAELDATCHSLPIVRELVSSAEPVELRTQV